MQIKKAIQGFVTKIREKVRIVYYVARHPALPWYVRVLALCVAGYALSPIDLVPDFIPILGYLDDLVIIPLGIWLVWRLVPEDIMNECTLRARNSGMLEKAWRMGIVIGLFWLIMAVLISVWIIDSQDWIKVLSK